MIDPLLPPFRRFWQTDRGLSLLLAILVAILFVLPPILTPGPIARISFDVFLTALLITGISTASGNPKVRGILTALVVGALAVRWIGWFVTSEALEVLAAVSVIASLAILAGVVLVRVFRRGRVTYDRILGAVAVYLLIGLTWAQMYTLLTRFAPDAFSRSAAETSSLGSFLYYSIVTLTTVGYGDITPVHPFARSLAMLEALIGQLYPSILLARLVSLELMDRASSEPPAGE